MFTKEIPFAIEKIFRQAFAKDKIYIFPAVLAHSDRVTRKRFNNLEDVRQKLKRELSVFPEVLLQFFAEHPKGQIVIAVEGAEYNPRTQVAKIGLDYLVQDIGVLQEEVVHLFDHLLGSNAQEYRMSEGYGITPAIQKIGQQIKEWYNVKRDSYPDAYAILNEREYLAQSVTKLFF